MFLCIANASSLISMIYGRAWIEFLFAPKYEKVMKTTLISSGIFSESSCTLKYNGCNANTESELHNKGNIAQKFR